MKELIIVDGYNVINRESRYRQYKEDLETARVKLIEDLVDYEALEDCDVAVVFDGSGGFGNLEKKKNILGVDVYFTRGSQTADSLIERLAYEAKENRNVIVVTADYDQQKAVFSEGVLRKTPKEMVKNIVEAKTNSTELIKTGTKRIFLEDCLSNKVKESLKHLICDS